VRLYKNIPLLITSFITAFILSFVLLIYFIQKDFNDFSMALVDGDSIVTLGQENTLSPAGATVNLLCRKNQPFALVLKWRMPLPEHQKQRFARNIDVDWFKNGNTAVPFGSQPDATILQSTLKSKSPENPVGLNNFLVITQTWGETLVSKPLDRYSIRRLNILLSSQNEFAFSIYEALFSFSTSKEFKSSKTVASLCQKKF